MNRTTSLRSIAALAVLAMATLTFAACSSESPRTADAERAEQALIDGIGEKEGGAVALVSREGAVSRYAVGDASSDGTPLTVDSVFRVGSISKPFTAAIVLQLVDEGKVDLDAPLSTYLPDASMGDEVSVRELLAHRSGLPDYTSHRDFITDSLVDPSCEMSGERVLGYAKEGESREPRGSFSYSNTNYLLLGQLIEEIDGVSLDDSLQNRIGKPLGLSSTAFDLPGAGVPSAVVGGWSAQGQDGDPDTPYSCLATGAFAAGALVSTVDDLTRFRSALVGGELISDDSLEEMTDFGDGPYGLGLFRFDIGEGEIAYNHNGGIPGFVSTMTFDPASGDAVIVLTNNDLINPVAMAETIVERW